MLSGSHLKVAMKTRNQESDNVRWQSRAKHVLPIRSMPETSGNDEGE
jgi:hypothetical protein